MRTRSDYQLRAGFSFVLGITLLGFAYNMYSPASDPSELAWAGVLLGTGLSLFIYAARMMWRLRADNRVQLDRRSRSVEGRYTDRRVKQLQLARGDRRSRSERRRAATRRFNVERGSWSGKESPYETANQ